MLETIFDFILIFLLKMIIWHFLELIVRARLNINSDGSCRILSPLCGVNDEVNTSGYGISAVKSEKKVGEKTGPCGIPAKLVRTIFAKRLLEIAVLLP